MAERPACVDGAADCRGHWRTAPRASPLRVRLPSAGAITGGEDQADGRATTPLRHRVARPLPPTRGGKPSITGGFGSGGSGPGSGLGAGGSGGSGVGRGSGPGIRLVALAGIVASRLMRAILPGGGGGESDNVARPWAGDGW